MSANDPAGWGTTPGAWQGAPGLQPVFRPPTPVAAIFGRIICFLGLAAAIICSVIWILVGMLSLAAGPLCTECIGGWVPPVIMGVIGPIVPLGWWIAVLIAQWRRSTLLLWSLPGWLLLGGLNIWAIEQFSALFNR